MSPCHSISMLAPAFVTLSTLVHVSALAARDSSNRSVARHSGRSPSAHDRRAVYACDHGAIGDGVADDTIALQSAIDAARSSNGTLRLTDGQYRITSYLDWGEWTGISVVGDGAGQWGTHGVSIWADGVNGTAHDFTGSAYGTVRGVSFTGSATSVMVLNGRTLDGGYGSDIVWIDCDFDNHGGVATFVNHMGEVITWRDCRFHSSGHPGLLITWRAGWWNVTVPSGRKLATGVSLTVFRIFGGELTGDNGANLVLDMEDAPTNGGDFAAYGVYFNTYGDHVASIAIKGSWNNVIVDGSRDEEDFKPPSNPSCGFIILDNGHLRGFRISGYSDGDENCPIVRGSGSLTAGSIIGRIEINITGDLRAVQLISTASVWLDVDGDVTQTTVQSTSITDISVSGDMEVTDGAGGVLVARKPLFTAGSVAWPIVGSGLFKASYAGDMLLFHSTAAGGTRSTSVISSHSQANATGNKGTGRLDMVDGGTVVHAEYTDTGDVFTVRRLA